MTTAEQLRNLPGLPAKTVPVPEWGLDVQLRGLSGKERDRYDSWKATIAKREDFAPVWAAGIVVLHVVGDDGKRAFTFEKLADITQMADDWAENRSGGVIEKLFWECDALSLLTKRSYEKKSDTSGDDLKKEAGTSSPESTAAQ